LHKKINSTEPSLSVRVPCICNLWFVYGQLIITSRPSMIKLTFTLLKLVPAVFEQKISFRTKFSFRTNFFEPIIDSIKVIFFFNWLLAKWLRLLVFLLGTHIHPSLTFQGKLTEEEVSVQLTSSYSYVVLYKKSLSMKSNW